MILICQNPSETLRGKGQNSQDGVQRIYCQTFGGKSPLFFHEIVLVRLTASCQIALKLRVGLADISMSKSQRDTERKHTDLPGWSTAYLLRNIRWQNTTHGIILVYGVVFVRDVVRTAQSKKSFADPPRIWSYAWRAWRACWRA